jgi:hypothetical protein
VRFTIWALSAFPSVSAKAPTDPAVLSIRPGMPLVPQTVFEAITVAALLNTLRLGSAGRGQGSKIPVAMPQEGPKTRLYFVGIDCIELHARRAREEKAGGQVATSHDQAILPLSDRPNMAGLSAYVGGSGSPQRLISAET